MNKNKKGKPFEDITHYAKLRLSVFQPPQVCLNYMGVEEKIRFADYQADFFQKRLGSSMLTFPYLGLPLTEYKQFIEKHYRRNEDLSTVFTLDMNMDIKNLKEILDLLIDIDQPVIILLIHRIWENTIPQRSLLSSYLEKEKLVFFSCQVDREDKRTNGSNLHLESITAGMDIVSLKQNRGFPRKADVKVSLNCIKFFDPSTCSLVDAENTLMDKQRNILQPIVFLNYDT